MTDSDSLRRAVEGCEAVVHLVAIRQGRPDEFRRVMVEGTRNLIAACDAGVQRFVLMSALGTSEETKDLVPYYNAKWRQEEDVKASGLEYVIFRPSFIFGRRGGVLPTFRNLARISPVTGIVGSGRQRIQPIWIDDVGAYFAASLEKSEATGRTFELGGARHTDGREPRLRARRAGRRLVGRVLGSASECARNPAAPDAAPAGRTDADPRDGDGAAAREHPTHA